MKKAIFIISGVLILALMLVGGAYAFFVYSVKTMHKKQVVAENVQITSEWLEITSEKPLKTTKMVQNVMLAIEDYDYDVARNDFGNIKLKDGTKINPEVQIVDENGKVYQLRDDLRIGDRVGFSLNRDLHGTYEFPKDVAYKTIRIRSDKPFRCHEIYWYDYDLK